ncbi:MAG: NADPH:quinone oxidoreductase family protein [Gemmatimonadota bacterium]
MKAMQCVEWGPPDRLRLAELADPQPKPGEVRVRVGAAGVNYPDALIVQKKYQVQPPLPFIPGAEVAGTIDAIGAGVTDRAIGQRVVAFVALGGFADMVCADARRTIPLPAGVSDEVAAGFTLTYATSQHALADRAQLKEGETLLVLGAGGGVGLAAVELGKLAGARVIAAAGTDEKLAACRAAGADELINYASADLRDAIKATTGGKGVDVIYDPVGGAYTETALRSIAWRGRLLVIGFAGGEIPRIPANLLLLKEASAVGVYWGEFAQRQPQDNKHLLGELMTWLAQGRLNPRAPKIFALADAPRALEDLLQRRAIGKLVLRPG